MPVFHLRLRLVSDVIASARSASSGGHHSLRRIPGAMLLGACARSLYPKLPPDASYRLFHSGAVRFGDGLPLVGRQVGLPLPLCLHQRKRKKRGVYHNLAVAEPKPGEQYLQAREGFLAAPARLLKPAMHYTMRTAIGPGGRARDGLLFGFEAIAQGQEFAARVEADREEDLTTLRTCLTGRLQLGRSRSAEFGAVVAEELDVEPWQVAEACNGRLLVLCVSDLALRDSLTGQPRLTPEAADFELPEGWQLDFERTYIRVRRYAPFNNARRRPDLERQVIVAGSVLAFQGTGQLPLTALRERLANGVGGYRQDGLGRVLLQPVVLESPELALETAPASAVSARKQLPQDPLGAWLAERLHHRMRLRAAEELARRWAAQLSWLRVGRAQWGTVRELAARSRRAGEHASAFIAALKTATEGGVAVRQWGRRRANVTGSQALQAAVIRERALEGQTLQLAVELLAWRMQRQQGGRR